MFVMTLDVKSTHCNNQECPSRIARQPNGSWMCVDCGAPILYKRINTAEPPPDPDTPIHVEHTDDQIHVKLGDAALGRIDWKGDKEPKMCGTCRLPMVESMTNLYYSCPTCGLSVPRDRREEALTMPGRKRYG